MMPTKQLKKDVNMSSTGFRINDTELGFNDENTGNDMNTYEESFSFEGLLNKNKPENLDRSGDWIISKLNKSKTSGVEKYLSRKYLIEMNDFMKEAKVSEITVNLPEEDAYVRIVNDENADKEEVIQMLNVKFSLYRYYSFLWMMSILIMSIFAVVGFVGILAPFPSLSGFIAGLTGMIGAYIDWKERDSKNAT